MIRYVSQGEKRLGWRNITIQNGGNTEAACGVQHFTCKLCPAHINQNRIIKLFSVASVALLPPTLVASIYGMNFKLMPELDWQFGYAWAIGLMVASALLPMWYFRRRGWLK